MPIHAAFLKYFMEVYQCGSIRLAARRLSISSSAVNRQILKIEDELGASLFNRSSSGIQPTAAGELLAAHIQRTLHDAEQTIEQIEKLSDASRPVIRIVGQESVIARFLPPALVQLHADYPEISTVFKAASGIQLQELLLMGSADIALAFDLQPHDDIEIRSVTTLPVGAVMTPTHPLAVRDSVSLSDCVPFPIVLPDHSWPLRERLDNEIENANLQLNIITSSNSVEFLKAMVDQDLGLGFQTVIGIESQVDQGALVHIPLTAPQPVLQKFMLCTRANSAPSIVIDRVLSLLISRLEDYSV